jgi:4-hydroxy-tetrahydrodipicolinate synthase
MSVELKGLIVPMLTPFDDTGEVDEAAFIRHLGFLEQHGVKRIMINGTTGEFFSLLPEERKALLKTARRHFDGQIILHAGGLGLAQNLVEVQWANDLGAAAVAVLPPIYPAGLPQEGIIDYFRALEEAAKVRFILYNFPKHTGNTITPEVLKAVPHFALKDSEKNLDLIEHTPRYFVGSSTEIYGPVQEGAAGFVSATANVRPELYSAMDMLVVSMKIEEAAVLQREIKAYSARFSSGGVSMLKQALSRILPGYPVHVRPPLMPRG